jgi:hypothetical protein
LRDEGAEDREGDFWVRQDREGADLQRENVRASYGTAVLKIALAPSVNFAR